MTVAEVLLICAVSAFATALGWFAARFTMEGAAEPGSHSAGSPSRSAASNGKRKATKPSIEGRLYIAVLKTGSLLPPPPPSSSPSQPSDGVDEQKVVVFAKLLTDAQTRLSISRIGEDFIEGAFFAKSEGEAAEQARSALDVIKQHAAGDASEEQTCPRAGIGLAPCEPPPQSAFDKIHAALSDPQLDGKEVVSLDNNARTAEAKASAKVMDSLGDALRSNEIALAYQPKLTVSNGHFESAEALFRWNSEKRDKLSIGELIVLAEQSGMIRELTLWSFKQAVLDQLELIDRGIDITTFVNLSADLISDSELALQIIETVKNTSGRIGVEITETSVIKETGHALANLELLSAAGIAISIDDYGTGLSSLRYLKKIPAQELKIDREFIKDLTTSHRDPMIVRSTIDLAHALGLTVTAEGVDDPTKMALLKVMGCDQLQGYHIAKPMPLDAMVDFIARPGKHDMSNISDTCAPHSFSIAKQK